MYLSLKDVTDILSVVKTIDGYSVTLWLSLTLPLYYLAFKKLLPRHNDKIEQTLAQKLSAIFSIPKIDAKIMLLSASLFVIGCIIAMIGESNIESLRNDGWTLKNHMINTGYYSMPVSELAKISGIRACRIEKIAEKYPREFSIIYTKNGSAKEGATATKASSKENATLLVTDSIAKKGLMERSEKILASYLNNNAVLNDGSIVAFDTLYKQNALFTYAVIYKLIEDSGYRFSFNLFKPFVKDKKGNRVQSVYVTDASGRLYIKSLLTISPPVVLHGELLARNFLGNINLNGQWTAIFSSDSVSPEAKGFGLVRIVRPLAAASSG